MTKEANFQVRLANQENYAINSFVCDAGRFHRTLLPMKIFCQQSHDKIFEKCSATGHLSDDEMAETPMPAGGRRVRKMMKYRRQLKAAEVMLILQTILSFKVI